MLPTIPALTRDTARPVAGGSPAWVHSTFRLAPERRTSTLWPDCMSASPLSFDSRHSAPSMALPSDVRVSTLTDWVVPCVTDAQPVKIERTPAHAHRPQNRHPAPRILDPCNLMLQRESLATSRSSS